MENYITWNIIPFKRFMLFYARICASFLHTSLESKVYCTIGNNTLQLNKKKEINSMTRNILIKFLSHFSTMYNSVTSIYLKYQYFKNENSLCNELIMILNIRKKFESKQQGYVSDFMERVHCQYLPRLPTSIIVAFD